MDLKERSLLFRQAVNESIRENDVIFENIGKNRLRAEVTSRIHESFTNATEFGWTSIVTVFQIEFTPNWVDYNGVHVFQEGDPWRVDWKTYRWAIRKLSHHQVMAIIGDDYNE